MNNKNLFSNFAPVMRNGSEATGGSVGVGAVARVVVDSVASGTVERAMISYSEAGLLPHFTVNLESKEVVRHLSLDSSAIGVTDAPIEAHRIGLTIWVMVLNPYGTLPTAEQSGWLGETIGEICDSVGAERVSLPFISLANSLVRSSRMSHGEWGSFSGVCGAAHVPSCGRYGPGFVDMAAFDAAFVPNVVEAVVEELTEAEEVDADAVALGAFGGHTVKLGSSGKAVSSLREAIGLGRGDFDDELESFVVEVQAECGIEETGVVDSDTWSALQDFLS